MFSKNFVQNKYFSSVLYSNIIHFLLIIVEFTFTPSVLQFVSIDQKGGTTKYCYHIKNDKNLEIF